MEHLALEIFDLDGKGGSKYAYLPPDTSITITDTSEIFASGDVWSHSFTLNVRANAHIFGTSGDIHGSRLHEQINKRRARLWGERLPLYLGYLKLDDEVDVDENGDVDVTFESGQKTFEDMIEGVNAREISVGDVVIGVALNRKRLVKISNVSGTFQLSEFTLSHPGLSKQLQQAEFDFSGGTDDFSAYTHRWPKLVLSKGIVDNLSTGESSQAINYTNVQEGYSDGNPFCNINVSYQRKIRKADDSEQTLREYIIRLGYGNDTTLGGDNETRFNNAPNFYLLHWLKRLFNDLGIHIEENQMLDVEDLKRVFLANLGCFYEEMDLNNDTMENYDSGSKEWERYGKYNFPKDFITQSHKFYAGDDERGKVLISRLEVEGFNSVHSLPGKMISLNESSIICEEKDISGYLAYATGDNYPNVEISEIIKATESAFGVRFLFSGDFSRVRIVLLRKIFRDNKIQELKCDVVSESKQENSIRGFRMTYGSGKDDTTYFYKGFDDALPKKKEIWKDDSDKHDYSQWELNSVYDDVQSKVTAFNKTCYVTPINGNAYGVKIDEDEDVFFPSLFEYAGYMDAEDGDCAGEEETIKTVTVNAKPLIMNNSDGIYSVLFNGDMKAPGKAEVAAQIPVVKNLEKTITLKCVSGPPHHVGGMDEGFEYDYDYYEAKILADIYVKEGYVLNLQDNYSFTANDGTLFDNAEIGLCFGIMRGSGDDALIKYDDDLIEKEGNEYWEIVPGSGAIDHPDTCDSYGKSWVYEASEASEQDEENPNTGTVVISTSEEAISKLQELFPKSNAPFYVDGKGYITGVQVYEYSWTEVHSDGRPGGGGGMERVEYSVLALFVSSYSESGSVNLGDYPSILAKNLRDIDLFTKDEENRNLLIELNTTNERASTLIDLCKMAYGTSEQQDDSPDSQPIILDNGVSARYGRFSLKLRAEKPNPYFNPALPEGNEVISTKAEAASAMTRLFTTANTNLLTRPKVDNATMRAAGWDAPGDGYATVMSMGAGVVYIDGVVHEILWTPIKPDGTVLTRAQLQTYVNSFSWLASSAIVSHDTQHLILDIDTTEERGVLLHELQAIYYAEDGETVDSVTIPGSNRRYLEITNPNLRGRGLADQFYKEYSYWIRNARIVTLTAYIELAQLLTLDKNKRVKVGDITGFVRKMQYTISNKTGLGMVTMEIMYI